MVCVWKLPLCLLLLLFSRFANNKWLLLYLLFIYKNSFGGSTTPGPTWWSWFRIWFEMIEYLITLTFYSLILARFNKHVLIAFNLLILQFYSFFDWHVWTPTITSAVQSLNLFRTRFLEIWFVLIKQMSHFSLEHTSLLHFLTHHLFDNCFNFFRCDSSLGATVLFMMKMSIVDLDRLILILNVFTHRRSWRWNKIYFLLFFTWLWISMFWDRIDRAMNITLSFIRIKMVVLTHIRRLLISFLILWIYWAFCQWICQTITSRIFVPWFIKLMILKKQLIVFLLLPLICLICHILLFDLTSLII